jgi:hypothetical protein
MDKLDLELTKDEVKWIATRYQKKAKIRVDELRNVLDYLRTEKPKLDTLSYTKAVAASQQWHEQFKGKADSTGEYSTKNVVLSLSKGYTWVEVPVEDLKTEGDNMGHCVGGDYYQKQVKAGKVKIFSLRDSSNKPHVTTEIDSKGRVEQVQGKENKEPVVKYHTYIEQLWNHLKIEHNEHTAKYVTDPKLLTEMAGSKKYRTYVARNPNLPVELMKVLAGDENENVRYNLASNPNLPVELIKGLTEDKSVNVRYYLATNPNLSVDVMKVLAKDKNADVRYYLAGNPNLPLEIMKGLAEDNDIEVRCSLAGNLNLPLEIMRVLAKDKEGYVRAGLAGNPNLPVELIGVLAKRVESVDVSVLWILARNPNLPVELMRVLAKNENANVRYYLAGNPNLPLEIVKGLAKDKDAAVRSKAEKHPNYRKP